MELRRGQFGLATMLSGTAAAGVLFAAFRWMGLPPRTSALVGVLLVVCLAVAAGLVWTLARSIEEE